MPTIEDTIIFATEAHRGQVDKAGVPYILHPLRMMCRQQNDTERIIALLHDVIEDTDYTFDDLRRMGYEEEIIEAVDCLTRRDDETYEAFIQRIKTNPLARRVKLADLQDNMDLRRIRLLQEHDLERLQRYQNAWYELTKEE
ncbi:MAG TPA: GTP pyrophosphokinase [Oceanobacillus sp.]|nr:GTP pyrophosphokinase [Oceanobacillus sp.]